MARNNFGTPTLIGPGETQTWTYTFNDDRGAQIATPHVISIGQNVFAIAQGEFRTPAGYVVYTVRFINEGPNVALYNLQEGGLS